MTKADDGSQPCEAPDVGSAPPAEHDSPGADSPSAARPDRVARCVAAGALVLAVGCTCSLGWSDRFAGGSTADSASADELAQRARCPDGLREVDESSIPRDSLSTESPTDPGFDLSCADLSGADLGGAQLTAADLVGADLSGADLGTARLDGADLSGADLSGAVLIGAHMDEVDLSSADLRNAHLGKAHLTNSRFDGTKFSEDAAEDGAADGAASTFVGFTDFTGSTFADVDLSDLCVMEGSAPPIWPDGFDPASHGYLPAEMTAAFEAIVPTMRCR